MAEQQQKEWNNIKISAGLLIGYIIAGLLNAFCFDLSLKEAFKDEKLALGIAGLGLSTIIYLRFFKK